MKICILVIIFAFGFVQNQCDKDKTVNTNKLSANKTMSDQTPENGKIERLPDGIEPETKVRKDTKNEKGEVVSTEILTVEQRLKELGAKYKDGKLIDDKNKEIRFFEPLCRGISEGFEEDKKARKEKEKEFAELEKNYTVIVLYCDPTQVL